MNFRFRIGARLSFRFQFRSIVRPSPPGSSVILAIAPAAVLTGAPVYLTAFFVYVDVEINIVDGKMQYLFDENGRRYLDAFRGIATMCCGHCHPHVVDAIVKQTKRIQHSTILYLNHSIADFAEALVAKMPGDLKVVFFTNSGTEANELAMMMAKLYTGFHLPLKNYLHTSLGK